MYSLFFLRIYIHIRRLGVSLTSLRHFYYPCECKIYIFFFLWIHGNPATFIAFLRLTIVTMTIQNSHFVEHLRIQITLNYYDPQNTTFIVSKNSTVVPHFTQNMIIFNSLQNKFLSENLNTLVLEHLYKSSYWERRYPQFK